MSTAMDPMDALRERRDLLRLLGTRVISPSVRAELRKLDEAICPDVPPIEVIRGAANPLTWLRMVVSRPRRAVIDWIQADLGEELEESYRVGSRRRAIQRVVKRSWEEALAVCGHWFLPSRLRDWLSGPPRIE